MNDPLDKKTLTYLQAETAYTEEIFRNKFESIQRSLLRDFQKDQELETETNSIKIDNFLYEFKLEPGKSLPVLYRTFGSTKDPKLVFDPNLSFPPLSGAELKSLRISPNHAKIAFILSEANSKPSRLYSLNIATGSLKDLGLENVNEVEWASDNQTLLATTSEGLLANKFFRLDDQGFLPEALLFESLDREIHLSLRKSRDLEYIFLYANTATTSDLYYLRASAAQGSLTQFWPKRSEVLYWADSAQERFVVRTNLFRTNFGVYSLSKVKPDPTKLEVIFEPKSDLATVDDFEVFRNFVAISWRDGSNDFLRLAPWQSNRRPIQVSVPGSLQSSKILNPGLNSNTFRFRSETYSSYPKIYELDFVHNSLKASDLPIAAANLASEFHEELIFSRSDDGTKVPISLVYLKNLKRDKPSPVLLYAYGAYGKYNRATFDPKLLALLRKGVVFALAHVRGSGFYGPAWHSAGKGLRKGKSVQDLVCAAQELISLGYTSPDLLFVEGRSAGAVIVGAAINSHPELFKGAILEAPFLDVVGSMTNSALPLTVREYSEWGDPADKNTLKYLKSYSPLSNLKRQIYPNILVIASYFDPVVSITQALKLIAGLRQLNSGENLVLLRVGASTDHERAMDEYDQNLIRASKYAFVLRLSEVGHH